MFNRKSSYALNKKDPNAIVYIDANDVIIRLTREDFASEEEFLKWKMWSDESYHVEDKRDVVDGKRLILQQIRSYRTSDLRRMRNAISQMHLGSQR